MTTFLQYVARDLLAKIGADNLHDVAVVFPNKRASLFLNQALIEAAGHPLWSPAYITISDLFRQHSTLVTPDKMALIFRLYNVYREVTGSDEPLDHFYSWGELMLADFDDLDKNQVDAHWLFDNLSALKSMNDTSYLSEAQRKILEDFFGPMKPQTELQQRFAKICGHMGDIYLRFRASLKEQHEAYEGMLYREVAESEINDWQHRQYVFIGFNFLQKVEQQLFSKLRDRALFYWDYDESYIKQLSPSANNANGKSSFETYLELFPNELSPERISDVLRPEAGNIYTNLKKPKDITYLSASTEDIQARYVTPWLKQNKRYEDSTRTAVVLCDERLLQNVVHCIPPEVKTVNVTLGFPLSATTASTLIRTLIDFQLNGFNDDRKYYRVPSLKKLLLHPYAKQLLPERNAILDQLAPYKAFYSVKDLMGDFTDAESQALLQPMSADANGQWPLLSWVMDALKRVAVGLGQKGKSGLKQQTADALAEEALFQAHQLISRLNDLVIIIDQPANGSAANGPQQTNVPVNDKQPVTKNLALRLMQQLIDATSIPFHGEPATGVQVMGVLETRNLDFDHILLLSCNEGNLPKGLDDASFIPHSLRAAFGMTTIENKASIYAFYFYSLLQRASDITLAFNNSTSDGKQGEMSRFMLQFLVEHASCQTIKQQTLRGGQQVKRNVPKPIKKDDWIMRVLTDMTSLSPTILGRYLRCNLKFYYYAILHLREPEEDEGVIDARKFGSIFHATAELIYKDMSKDMTQAVTKDMIDGLRNDPSRISRFIDEAFKLQLIEERHLEKQGITTAQIKLPPADGMQLLIKKVVESYIRRLLEIDSALAPITFHLLEGEVSESFSFQVDGQTKDIELKGNVDRLDEITTLQGKLLRVIDYKTGSSQNPLKGIDDVFDPACISNHADYYLQAFLYADIIRNDNTHNPQQLPVAPALLFIREAGGDDYNPILTFKPAKKPVELIDDISRHHNEFNAKLKTLLEEIFDREKPFLPTADTKQCGSCAYRDLCGLQ